MTRPLLAVIIGLMILAFACGVLMGTHLNRYEYVKISDYPARFDRWSGNLQVISFSMTEEAKKQWASTLPTPKLESREPTAAPPK